jgi:hypothetical protein
MSSERFSAPAWGAWLCGLMLLAMTWVCAGCATSDGDSESERPWNSPQGWENGLPPQMYERR